MVRTQQGTDVTYCTVCPVLKQTSFISYPKTLCREGCVEVVLYSIYYAVNGVIQQQNECVQLFHKLSHPPAPESGSFMCFCGGMLKCPWVRNPVLQHCLCRGPWSPWRIYPAFFGFTAFLLGLRCIHPRWWCQHRNRKHNWFYIHCWGGCRSSVTEPTQVRREGLYGWGPQVLPQGFTTSAVWEWPCNNALRLGVKNSNDFPLLPPCTSSVDYDHSILLPLRSTHQRD